MAKKTPLTFEKALAGLEQTADKLAGEDLPLEEALQLYEQGMQYYQTCETILESARQKIEQYDRQSGELKKIDRKGQ
ncbi:MAG TPA: exodeoxyribonuclease VII small subunit [Clostridiales bacterium]|jgi:exodeoxyribonuclease VII small subunit|nr:exodeoxyribonuclease VII small subunit [Clostridiales bacterium]